MERNALVDRPPAELRDAMGQLHGIIAMAQRYLLLNASAYDETQAWQADGATSMAAWLAAEFGLGQETAAEWARVARAFDELPSVARALEDGRLSFDQARALTKFATPETEEALVRKAVALSAGHLRRMAQRARVLSPEDERDAYQGRELRLRWDHDRHCLRIQGLLPEADGAVVEKALERIVGDAPPEPATDVIAPWRTRLADALVELASTRLDGDADADRATVVLHVDAAVLEGSNGMAELETGGAITCETAKRLACDSRWQVVAHDAKGVAVGIGRTSRQVPPWMVRELRRRDLGCRFPGCNRTRWVAAHHLIHWALAGRTDLDNLILLCGTHHRLIHEGGWHVSGDPNGQLTFVGPYGHVVSDGGPPPLRAEVRRRFVEIDEPSHLPP